MQVQKGITASLFLFFFKLIDGWLKCDLLLCKSPVKIMTFRTLRLRKEMTDSPT